MKKSQKYSYKKGEIYAPDSVDELPRYCNQFLEKMEEYDEHTGLRYGLSDHIYKGERYEYGTVICIKSFEVEIIINH